MNLKSSNYLIKSFIFIIYFTNLVSYVFSQNFVENPSFETSSPIYGTYLKEIYGWELSYFSSDIFSAHIQYDEDQRYCNSVPYNSYGYQKARTGSNYAGVFILKEALQTKLINSLQKDSLYYIEYYISLADSSDCTIWQLGAAFTKEALRYDALHSEVLKCIPQIFNTEDRYIPPGTNWMKICGTYKACGGEQYLIISGFTHPTFEKRKNISFNGNNRLYIFFDDVMVAKVPTDFKVHPLDMCVVEKGKSIVLENLLFEFGKAQIIKESEPELIKLLSFLNENLEIKIKIYGHTDDIGEDSFNDELSRNRAASVKIFLVNNGIMANRIETFGYGSSRPIISDKNKKQFWQNRRVEIVFD